MAISRLLKIRIYNHGGEGRSKQAAVCAGGGPGADSAGYALTSLDSLF
jgi:hypothetical protein